MRKEGRKKQRKKERKTNKQTKMKSRMHTNSTATRDDATVPYSSFNMTQNRRYESLISRI
jgi:hypothetical protein